MAGVSRRCILPNFGVKLFATEYDMHTYLGRLGFQIRNKVWGCDIWEMKKEPDLAAISQMLGEGVYIAQQLSDGQPSILRRPLRK